MHVFVFTKLVLIFAARRWLFREFYGWKGRHPFIFGQARQGILLVHTQCQQPRHLSSSSSIRGMMKMKWDTSLSYLVMNTMWLALLCSSQTLVNAFSSLEGMACSKVEGAIYAFPRIHLPAAAIKAAKAEGVSPDTFYACCLLDATGIAVVPGSGFHQVSRSIFLSDLCCLNTCRSCFRAHACML